MTTAIADGTTILVVDDDPVAVESMVALLEKSGYAVISAMDGPSGLEMARRHRPELILLDVLMPGMSGVETCRALLGEPALTDIPVIFITASTSDGALEEAFAAGGRDFVSKPIRRVELLTRVGHILEMQKAALKLSEEQKLKEVLETAGAVCHSLNQPLQYVLGAIQILLMDMVPDDPVFRQLDTVREKVEYMGKITRKLAEITRYRTQSQAGG
jgi:CheY-like chemotaxis protein